LGGWKFPPVFMRCPTSLRTVALLQNSRFSGCNFRLCKLVASTFRNVMDVALSYFKRQQVSSSPLLPPSHPVPASQIRSTILALYKLVCMYVHVYVWDVFIQNATHSSVACVTTTTFSGFTLSQLELDMRAASYHKNCRRLCKQLGTSAPKYWQLKPCWARKSLLVPLPSYEPRVGPGQPLSLLSPLSIHFPISYSFYVSLFPFLIRFIYFLLLSIPSLSTRIVPLCFVGSDRPWV